MPWTKTVVRSLRRFSLALLLVASLCLLVWQNARTQSPLRRITSTTEEGININPSMSGDGRIVAFESTEDIAGAGGAESFRAIRANVSVDPPTFQQLSATRAPAPAISQDGSRIAFASSDNPLGTNNDGNSEIFLHDGAKLIQITNTTPEDVTSRTIDGNFLPSISDDGRFIAFSSNRDLANLNADGNLEIFVYDTFGAVFTQLTNASGIVGFTDARISGNSVSVAYIRDSGATSSTNRDLLLQNRVGPPSVRVLATAAQALAVTRGRAISDDGLRVVWAAETAVNTSQVFLYDGRNNFTQQVTSLGVRATDVPLHATINGEGSRITFATRRTFLGNSDGSVDLYSYDIPSSTFARVTSGPSNATSEVLSSMNDEGSFVAFNFPRVLTGVANSDLANTSEIYVTETPARPAFGTLSILNGASFGLEPSSIEAIAPDSIAVARGRALAFTTEQSQRLPDGTFPRALGGTTVTVNGRQAQVFFVSPGQVNFLVPPETQLGSADFAVTNSDGFQSRGTVPTLRASPGVFTFSGDGLGEGVILNADTMQPGPFDPANGDLRLIIFSTGVRNSLMISVTAGGRALTVESIIQSPNLPGLDEIHVLAPPDLRGAGTVDLVVRADARDSNPSALTFRGDARRDIAINEFLADPPGANASALEGDANQDGTRSASEDEFIELVNTTTRDIDIGGYQILTRSGSGSSDILRHTFTAGTILPACAAIVVFGGGNPNPADQFFGSSQVMTASPGPLTLNNSRGVIMLRDQAGTIGSFLAYGGSTGLDADDNQSLTRSPDVTGVFTPHLSASGGAHPFSPGTQSTRMPFSSCTPSITRIEVSPVTATINIGTQQQFVARAFASSDNEVPGVIVFWQSSNTSVATIDQNGLTTGVAAGSTEIRATGRGVQSDPAMLTVAQPPPVLTSLTISPTTATISVGEVQQYAAQAKDQFGQDIGGVTINYASNDTTTATVDAVSATSPGGSAAATVTGRANGQAEIRATANNGLITVTSSPATIKVEPGAGQLLISEFRTRGPAGSSDEFVEIYNPTTSTLSIGGLRIRASNSGGTISDRVTITAGATLGAGCHYLVANGSGTGYSGIVPANQNYGTGITDNGGVAITGSNGTTIIDAVGMSSGSSFKEGNSLTPLTGTFNQSYERKPGGSLGNGVDTDNNAGDFALVSPSNPQNSASACLNTSATELAITMTDSPDPVVSGATITYTLTVTNNGVAVAQNVIITDNLAAEVSFVSCNATSGGICGGSGNNRVMTFSSLMAGASATITLVATVNSAAGTTITNAATVNSSTPDSNGSNNSFTATTTVESPVAPQPALSINDVSLNENNSGPTTFTFTVSLSSPASGSGVTFDISTQDNTALAAGSDYVSKTLTNQTITAGNSSYTFEVMINGDTLVETDENFFVNVTNVVGATASDSMGQGTIQNDDTANLIISQLYGGGGNTSAQFTHDFIEILNRGTTTVNLSGWSIQYAGATGTGKWSATNLSGTIQPGQYYLIQENSGGAVGNPLPVPDATGTIAMAASAGKVALVSSTTPLSGGCPAAASISDLVGYGSTASCFEGNGPAPAPSAAAADFRRAGGCTDINQNGADFFFHAPVPRNTSSPTNNCVMVAPPNLTITDVTVIEGFAATTTAIFTVSLSSPAPSTDVTFDIATADGTAQDNDPAATEDNDYVAKTLANQIIPAGQQTYSFSVKVNGDAAVEPTETFLVNVTNVSGAVVNDGQGAGTIQNDDVPVLTINDVALSEENGGTRLFTFTVSLSTNAPGPVTFDIATADGAAQDDSPAQSEDNDYLARSETSQVVPTGQASYNFEVTVNGDLNLEEDEAFFVNVTNVSGAIVADGQGIGTIQNDDSPTLAVNEIVATEGDAGTTALTFTVTSSLPAPAGGITFDIATADDTAQDDNPVATEDNDYVAKSLTTQMIPFNQTTYSFEVAVSGDLLVESDESFFVNLTNVSGATVSDGQGRGMILNDDLANVVISQIYGAGGNSGASHQNDFIEIFNRGTTTVNLSGWSVQYIGATSSGTWSTTSLSGTLVPGQYYLVQESSGGLNGTSLPTPDVTGTINMAATAGKVALVSLTTPLSGGCPTSANLLDLVGYGATASCFEGTGPAPAPGATVSDFRKVGGCIDVNDNAADFLMAPPDPRNTASPLNDCNAPPNLTVDNVTVSEGNGGPVVANFTVSLSAPASAGGVTFDIGTQDDSSTTADNDYVANTLTAQIISHGNQTFNFAVTVNGDINVEPNETFFVNITNVTGANVIDGQGVGIIQNDDSVPLPNLSINDVSSSEGNSGPTSFSFTVSLSEPAPQGGVTFDITTADVIAQDDNPTTEDNDYVAQSLTTQTITAGNTTYNFNVTVNGDTLVETSETFLVNIINVSNANLSDAQGQGTIQNDDTPLLVISQLYGGGGNAGATYTNDFIEIFNRGTTTINFSVTPYSVQYAAATSNFSANKTDITSGVLLPGHYFLLQEGSGGANGVALPAADATGNINLAATAGKVALVIGTTSLTGSGCPLALTIADFLGYGASANCFETAPIVMSSTNANARSVIRTASCADTNNNTADFSNPTSAPAARNVATAPVSCP